MCVMPDQQIIQIQAPDVQVPWSTLCTSDIDTVYILYDMLIDHGPNDPRNVAFKVPGNKQSNQIGELAAIIIVIQKVHHFCPLEIISDLRYAIEKHLKTKRVIN